jgi:hypothetical protein
MGIASGVRAAGVWIALATTVLLVACGGDGGTPTHTASSGRADHRYDPLSITGTAVATATVGQRYAFTPSANARRGATLTFSISGQPRWAAFSRTSGTLSGTPAAQDVGTHGPIQITVSDGNSTRALPSFAIRVAATSASAPGPSPALANATISWVPPTQNTDGSGVGPLRGYKIYYGTASQQYTTTITVSNAGLTTYVIDGLNVGTTYYFAVTAVTAAGIESALSPEVAAMIS